MVEYMYDHIYQVNQYPQIFSFAFNVGDLYLFISHALAHTVIDRMHLPRRFRAHYKKIIAETGYFTHIDQCNVKSLLA